MWHLYPGTGALLYCVRIALPRAARIIARTIIFECRQAEGLAGQTVVSTSPAGIVAIIEDDDAMRQAIRRVLETEGFMTAAFDSAEAFLASDALSRAYCLVLDIRLPGISGLDLHEHLQATENAVPTVFITAHEDTRVRRLLKNGTYCCLFKPFLGETLIQAVTRAIAR